MFSLRYYRFLLQSYLNRQALHLFQFQLFIKWLRNLLFAQQFFSFLSFSFTRKLHQATKEIDKAVQKGVLHANTGARRKARMAAAKRNALIKGGLYTPA